MNITFEKGLPGFESYKTFRLCDIEGDSNLN